MYSDIMEFRSLICPERPSQQKRFKSRTRHMNGDRHQTKRILSVFMSKNGKGVGCV